MQNPAPLTEADRQRWIEVKIQLARQHASKLKEELAKLEQELLDIEEVQARSTHLR